MQSHQQQHTLQQRKAQAVSQIMAGLDWWTKQNTRSPLSFTFVTQTVATKYEPILHPYYDEASWIPDVMSKLGFNGSRFASTQAYVNKLRQDHDADWGFVIFMVDSFNDSNGKFSDGYFAYSYLGGPFMVMTYDNNGYGISNMAVVAAHETGHIFHALDEYAGASSPNNYSAGYFPTINGNHAFSTTANEADSIMRGGLRWGLDEWARKMVGWRDLDENNQDDVVGQLPTSNINQQGAPGSAAFSGSATVSILARQGNANGFGLTVDTISKVEYRLGNGQWAEAVATDGHFDSSTEAFQIVVPASQASAQGVITAQDVELRIATYFSEASGTGSTSGGGTASTTGNLDRAHAFPNPFKPNSALGHTDVTFTSLTPGAKVKIFTLGGETVYEKEAPAGTLQWNAVDDGGQAVASGVYYYLITDSAGHTKKGKLAVIR